MSRFSSRTLFAPETSMALVFCTPCSKFHLIEKFIVTPYFTLQNCTLFECTCTCKYWYLHSRFYGITDSLVASKLTTVTLKQKAQNNYSHICSEDYCINGTSTVCVHGSSISFESLDSSSTFEDVCRLKSDMTTNNQWGAGIAYNLQHLQ